STRQPSAAYAPELLLRLHQVLVVLGDIGAARDCIEQAQAWIRRAAEHMPEAWRESFVGRNRVNAAVAAAWRAMNTAA
ncbi:MAG: hypothetical protein RL227_1724, partial [Pseudomonadota bacterium]